MSVKGCLITVVAIGACASAAFANFDSTALGVHIGERIRYTGMSAPPAPSRYVTYKRMAECLSSSAPILEYTDTRGNFRPHYPSGEAAVVLTHNEIVTVVGIAAALNTLHYVQFRKANGQSGCLDAQSFAPATP